MGFFESLFKAIGRAIGSAIEKVGDFIGSNTVSNWGIDIQDRCTERIASESSYDKKKSDINKTARISEALEQISSGHLARATDMERQCARCVEDYFERITDMLTSNQDMDNYKAAFKSLERNKNRIIKDIDGSIRNPLAKRLSIDDKECYRILQMEAGDDKRSLMDNFVNTVIEQAVDELAKKTHDSLIEVNQEIDEFFTSIEEEQKAALLEIKNHLNMMIENMNEEKVDKEMHCVTPIVLVMATELIRKVLS